MKKDKKKQSQNSISNFVHDQTQLQQTESQKTKVSNSFKQTKHINCICIHNDILYLGIYQDQLIQVFISDSLLGTTNSKICLYSISEPEIIPMENEEEQDFILNQIKTIVLHYQIVHMIKANDKYFVSIPQTDGNSFIGLWDTNSTLLVTAIKAHSSQVSQLIFINNNQYLATSSWDSTVKVWNLLNNQKDQPLKIHKGHYPILQLKQLNEQILIIGGDDCYLTFWNWVKNQVIKKQFGHAGSVTYIQTVDNWIFTAGGDNKFKYWQANAIQSTQSNNSINGSGFRQKYEIKKIQQHKEEYDSIVFGVIYDNYLLLIDRQGQLFLMVHDKQYHHIGNFFQYNQTITGIDVYKDYVLVTTTKGNLKHFNIKSQIEKLHISLPQQHNILISQTQILNVDSQTLVKNIHSNSIIQQQNQNSQNQDIK